MNKNTLTFERKLYVAPACKTHVLAMEDGMMQGGATVSGGYNSNNHTEYLGGEEDGGDLS